MTNRKFKFETKHSSTYATEENADRAIAKKGFDGFRHFMMRTEDGRWFPVFVGQDAMQAGVHFHFHVVG